MSATFLSLRELIVKIESLPTDRIAQVADFVEFLQQRVSPLESVPQRRPLADDNLNFPVDHLGGWPDRLTLQRGALYGDDGR